MLNLLHICAECSMFRRALPHAMFSHRRRRHRNHKAPDLDKTYISCDTLVFAKHSSRLHEKPNSVTEWRKKFDYKFFSSPLLLASSTNLPQSTFIHHQTSREWKVCWITNFSFSLWIIELQKLSTGRCVPKIRAQSLFSSIRRKTYGNFLLKLRYQ